MRECGSGKKTGLPYCQDTGMALVFLEVGQDVHLTGAVEEEVTAGIRAAYEKGYFRKSVLDPITRVNTKDNTPGVIHYSLVPGDKVKITVAPKGFGSENMSVLKMLKPSDGLAGIKKMVLESVQNAGVALARQWCWVSASAGRLNWLRSWPSGSCCGKSAVK